MTPLIGEYQLHPTVVESISDHIKTDRSLDRAGVLNGLIEGFKNLESINPYEVVCDLATGSDELSLILAAEANVVERYRLHEHTQAVLGGFEADYAQTFSNVHDKKIIRTILLLQDIGKSLCVSSGRNAHKQTVYNMQVAKNLLLAVDERILNEAEKSLIARLVGQDIYGSTIKGATLGFTKPGHMTLDEAHTHLEELKANCTEQHLPKLPRYMEAIYLADVSAYTTHRHYRTAPSGTKTACLPTFDHLFKKGINGKLRFKGRVHNQVLTTLKTLTS